ncbi:hypothetical protein [Ponticoccus alexandrii]|uniref:Uncharacterized protein n=1 Tax=Ponticoccus alexandrii TaxID=1943633 RepID=A0ABX7FAB3_9RHOB|nr:hypothetical protein [Ponticoccus alexandrii]ETA51471.1 hypothetical protein P279_14005 [Rhodobacteraceae bacterium PD-2]QRF66489.1 hypothetical protein GQA70_09315 [Ponticoccus alexandrii]
MIRIDFIGVVEMGGVESDPLTVTLSATSATGQGGGTGSFDVPARFVGTVFAPGRSARLHLHDGQVIEMAVTSFDPWRGRARVEVPGPLPMAQARRA